MGNVKGLQDPYRNPTTQQGWAERWGQNAAMVTSFADGSKISFEQAIVANATGFKVRSRGMSRGVKYDGSIMDIARCTTSTSCAASAASSTTRSGRR
jgi:predicted homoserine dehydrogenase-like protein